MRSGLTRRGFVRLAAATTSAGLLAACGATPTATPVPTKPPAPTATKPPAGAPTAVPTAAPKTSGTVVVYGWSGNWDLWFKDWTAQFEKDTGLKVQYLSGSGLDMFTRVLTEKANPRADLLLSSVSYVNNANNLGVMAPIAWEKIPNAAEVPDKFKQKVFSCFGWDLWHIAYNPKTVKAADLPKKWADLTDPKWANRLIMRDPGQDNMAWMWLAVQSKFGDDEAWRVLLGMYKNSNLWVSSVGDLVSALALGEKDISPASVGHIVQAYAQNPAVVASAMPDTPILMLNGLGVVKGGPNPDGAAKFINFMLGEYALDYAMNIGAANFTVNSKVKVTNEKLVTVGLGGMSTEDVLKIAFLPDWDYWTQNVGENQTRLGALSAELIKRVNAQKT